MSFWRPAENPGTRPLRSWAFDIGCAVVAGAASLARFSFGQAVHPVHLSLAASALVAVLTAGALPLRRVWPGPVFVWTLLAAAALAQWPDKGALFPVALAISLYTVAAMMRRAEALAAAVLTAGVMLMVVAQDSTRHWAVAISGAAGFAAAVVIVGLRERTQNRAGASPGRAGRLTSTTRSRLLATGRGQWPAIWPPSMCKISPVMYGADSRNKMPSTTSLTWPTRPSGGSWSPSSV